MSSAHSTRNTSHSLSSAARAFLNGHGWARISDLSRVKGSLRTAITSRFAGSLWTDLASRARIYCRGLLGFVAVVSSRLTSVVVAPHRTPVTMGPGTLTSRVAIVSGGGSGIGPAHGARARSCGATVVTCGRRAEPLRHAVALGPGGAVEVIACDIREEDEVDAPVDKVLERHGQIDLLVNNAAGKSPVTRGGHHA